MQAIRFPFAIPQIGEEEKEAVLRVLDQPILTDGPENAQFEEKFVEQWPDLNAVAVSSCTTAMYLVHLAHGLGPGDEVVMPAMTHVATAHAVEMCGAKPVFVDSEKETGNMDVDQMNEAINSKTRCVVMAHYIGTTSKELSRMREPLEKLGMYVLEDRATCGPHSLDGNIMCFSFYPTKHITCGEGGMVVCKPELAQQIRLMRAYGVDTNHKARVVAGQYDTVALGGNFRMTEMQAAIGRVQLGKSTYMLYKRRDNAKWLCKYLEGFKFYKSDYCVNVMVEGADRDLVIKYIGEHGIGTTIHYATPVPFMKYYRRNDTNHPVAEWIAKSCISLPVGPHLEVENMRHIANTFKQALEVHKEVAWT